MFRKSFICRTRGLASGAAVSGLLCFANVAQAVPKSDTFGVTELSVESKTAHQNYAKSDSTHDWQVSEMLASSGVDGQCTPGLAVARSVADRHAPQDVGGRLDVTKPWRLNIPDPVNGNSQYRSISGAKVVPVSQTAPASETVTPCFENFDEVAIDQGREQSGRQLANLRPSRVGSGWPASRPLWWASSARTASLLPVGSTVITSGFGPRYHPILRTVRGHHGIDLAAPIGTPIYATQSGVVRAAEWNGGYGLFVSLDHGAGVETRFGHMSRLNVFAGQRVRKGQTIGYVGSTGMSTGPHLHYELRVNGQATNPLLGPRK